MATASHSPPPTHTHTHTHTHTPHPTTPTQTHHSQKITTTMRVRASPPGVDKGRVLPVGPPQEVDGPREEGRQPLQPGRPAPDLILRQQPAGRMHAALNRAGQGRAGPCLAAAPARPGAPPPAPAPRHAWRKGGGLTAPAARAAGARAHSAPRAPSPPGLWAAPAAQHRAAAPSAAGPFAPSRAPARRPTPAPLRGPPAPRTAWFVFCF